jgi:hypothetical protein
VRTVPSGPTGSHNSRTRVVTSGSSHRIHVAVADGLTCRFVPVSAPPPSWRTDSSHHASCPHVVVDRPDRGSGSLNLTSSNMRRPRLPFVPLVIASTRPLKPVEPLRRTAVTPCYRPRWDGTRCEYRVPDLAPTHCPSAGATNARPSIRQDDGRRSPPDHGRHTGRGGGGVGSRHLGSAGWGRPPRTTAPRSSRR